MEVVKQTDEYTVFQKRSKRYAVRSKSNNQWISGPDKIKILLEQKLIKAAVPKPKKEEAKEVEAKETSEETPAEGTESEEKTEATE